MHDDIVVTITPRQVKVNSGEQATAIITLRNKSEDTENYRLHAEGEIADWVTIVPEQVAAFSGEETRAKLVLKAPKDARATVYDVSIRAVAQHQAGVEDLAQLEVEIEGVSAESDAPPPISSGTRTSQGIEVDVEAVPGDGLPPAAGQWRVQVRNASNFFYTYNFAVSGVKPAALSVDPPQLALMPRTEQSVVLSLQLADANEAKSYPFILRTYSNLNILDRTEVTLKLEVQPPKTAGSEQPDAPAPLDGPILERSSGPIQFEVGVDHRRVSLMSGTPQHVNLFIQNNSGSQLALELRCEGVPDQWIALSSDFVTLQPRKSTSADLTLTAPPDIPSGSYPLSLRVQARNQPALSVRINLLAEAGDGAQVRASPAMKISVDSPSVAVAPGGRVETIVTVQNLTNAMDRVAVRVEGIAAEWVKIIPQEQTIFQLESTRTQIVIEPPDEPAQSVAGLYPLIFHGCFQESAGQESTTTSELEIQLIGDYELSLAQAKAQATQQATYQIAVKNNSNSPLELRFQGSDRAQLLDYKFDPLLLNIPPQESNNATLTVRARSTTTEERSVPFNVKGQGEYLLHGGGRVMATGHEASATFSQLPPPELTVFVDPPEAETTIKAHQFQVRVRNPSSATVRVRLDAAAERRGLDFQADPREFEIGPNSDTKVMLVAQAKDRPKPGRRREQVFRVTATPLDNEVKGATGTGTLVQINTDPKKQLRWRWPMIAALLLGILGLPLTMSGLLYRLPAVIASMFRSQTPVAAIAPSPSAAPIVTEPAPTIPTLAPSPSASIGPQAAAAVTASKAAKNSQDDAGNTTTFQPGNVVDGRPETAWRVPGNGIDDWLLLEFDSPIRVTEIHIITGYAKIDPTTGKDRFPENRRVTQVRLEFSEPAPSVSAQLKDERSMQRITLTTPVTTSSVRMIIEASTEPTKPNDNAAISEIVVIGAKLSS